MVFFWGCLLGRDNEEEKDDVNADGRHFRSFVAFQAQGGGAAGNVRHLRHGRCRCRRCARGTANRRKSRAGPSLTEAQVHFEGNPPLFSQGSVEVGAIGATNYAVPTVKPMSPIAPPPTYRLVSRSQCALLRLCYEQKWEDAMRRVQSSKHRDEAQCRTKDTLRTALHLSTLPGTYCPPPILLALLEANPHAATVRDRPSAGPNVACGSTPLHLLCGGRHKNDPNLIRHFVDAAISCSGCENDAGKAGGVTRDPYLHVHLYSPLFVACRESARPETIQLLVEASFGTGPSAAWIAPVTGAEPWDDIVAMTRYLDRSTPDGCRLTMPQALPPFVPIAELWRHVHNLFDALKDDPEGLERMRHVTCRLLLEPPVRSMNGEGGTAESTPHQPPQPVAHVVDDRTRAWASVILLLRPHVKSFETLLHSVVNIGVPTAVPIVRLYQIICVLFPELLEEKDANMQLPLHAALHRSPKLERFAERGTVSASPQKIWARDILPVLVRCSVESRPDCAIAVDPRSRLFPALLAASMSAPISVVYELLQASIPCMFGVE